MCDIDGESWEWWCVTTRRAAKPHVCIECGFTIPKGERYDVLAYGWEGRAWAEKIHRECHALALRSAEVVCGERYWTIGEMTEHVGICETVLFGDPDDIPIDYEETDRDGAREVYLAFEAIRLKYSGTEIEAGGEG